MTVAHTDTGVITHRESSGEAQLSSPEHAGVAGATPCTDPGALNRMRLLCR